MFLIWSILANSYLFKVAWSLTTRYGSSQWLTLSASSRRGWEMCPPCRFFDHCILTGSPWKLILHDFSSNFILVMWLVNTGVFLGDLKRLSLMMELLIHCYTALVLEIECKFGYLSATYKVTVYHTTFFLSLGSSLQISGQ